MKKSIGIFRKVWLNLITQMKCCFFSGKDGVSILGNIVFILFTLTGTTAIVICSLVIASQPQWGEEGGKKLSSAVAEPLDDSKPFQVRIIFLLLAKKMDDEKISCMNYVNCMNTFALDFTTSTFVSE